MIALPGAARIELMRHGDTGQVSYRGQLDDELSPLGWQQLRAATAGLQWDLIVSSTLRRCAAFAAELAAGRAIPVRFDARLIEYHFGQWQGVPIARLQRESPEALQRYLHDPARFAPPSAEPFDAFRSRLGEALDDVVAQAEGRRVLVITHGAAIRVLRCVAEGRGFGDMAAIEVTHASRHSLAWPPGAS